MIDLMTIDSITRTQAYHQLVSYFDEEKDRVKMYHSTCDGQPCIEFFLSRNRLPFSLSLYRLNPVEEGLLNWAVEQGYIRITPGKDGAVMAERVKDFQCPHPVYTHVIETPDGRIIRVNDITPDIIADFREDAWWVESDDARANNSKLAGEIRRLAYGYDYGMNAPLFDGLDDALNLSRADQASRFSHSVYREDRPVRQGMELLIDDAWERLYNELMGDGWQAVKPHVGMMRIDTIGFVMLNVPAVMVGVWGWEINTTQITHLPTGKVAMYLPNNRENEGGRGEIAITAMLMLEQAIGDLNTEDECFEYGRKVTVNQLERLYRMDRLPRIAYPARAVGALKAKITRQAKAPKN